MQMQNALTSHIRGRKCTLDPVQQVLGRCRLILVVIWLMKRPSNVYNKFISIWPSFRGSDVINLFLLEGIIFLDHFLCEIKSSKLA